MKNCPNCGAAIDGSKCDYCGTIFEGPVVPVRLKFDPYMSKATLLTARVEVPEFECRTYPATIPNTVKEEAMNQLMKLLEPFLIIQEHHDYANLMHNYTVGLKVVDPNG